jgi:hypothetical protein
MKQILILFWTTLFISCIIYIIYARIDKIKNDKKYSKNLKQINNYESN